MRTLTEQLVQYAAYHRDRRNILTHFVGIPLIVAAVAVLLSRPGLAVGGMTLTPALLLVAAMLAYYFALDVGLACVMVVLFSLALWLGAWAATQATATWLAIGAGAFVVGWVFQFIGHFYEGRKPAFVDDIVGLAIGPLFVVAEALFMLGLRPTLGRAVDDGARTLRGH